MFKTDIKILYKIKNKIISLLMQIKAMVFLAKTKLYKLKPQAQSLKLIHSNNLSYKLHFSYEHDYHGIKTKI